MKQARDRTLELLNTSDIADYIEEGRSNWIQPPIRERLIRDHWAMNKFKELF